MSEFKAAAKSYAEIGWPIFPCCPKGKRPLTKNGFKDATTDLAQIDKWWDEWPNANVAVQCGDTSGIYAIDVDVRPDEKDGRESISQIPVPLPPTVLQYTSNGGYHLLFRSDTPIKSRANAWPGIDIKGKGYLIVAPSVHESGTRYVWAPGRAPWECTLAPWPEGLEPLNGSCTPHEALAPIPTAGLGKDWRSRASAYLAECRPAVQGEGGHNTLFWAASSMTQGLGLNFNQALQILAEEYNPRCVPPWNLDDPRERKDFIRKVQESIDKPLKKQRGWLLRDDVQSMDEATIRRIVRNHTEAEELAVGPAVTDEYLCNPPGMLGVACRWINETSLRPQPWLTIGAMLAFGGALVGRRVRDSNDLRTNLYAMGIAPASAGKDHAPSSVRKLAAAADASDLIGGVDITSDSAIESRLARNPATLLLWDEIGTMLTGMKSYHARLKSQVVSLLMQLYSASKSIYHGREYVDLEKRKTIIQPCCSLYGMSTYERLIQGSTPGEFQDGWLSRCLIFLSRNVPSKVRGRANSPPPKELIDWVRAWWERFPVSDLLAVQGEEHLHTPTPILVQTDEQAEQYYIAFDRWADTQAEKWSKIASLWRRAEENARKCGIIVASGCNFNAPQVTMEIAEWACNVVARIITDTCNILEPQIYMKHAKEPEKDASKVLKVITRAGVDGISRTQLTRKTQWVRRQQRNSIIEDLRDAEQIVVRRHNDKTVFIATVYAK